MASRNLRVEVGGRRGRLLRYRHATGGSFPRPRQPHQAKPDSAPWAKAELSIAHGVLAGAALKLRSARGRM
jgi:hypothetical protein